MSGSLTANSLKVASLPHVRQFVRPRLIELAASDVILPDIVVPQAVRVPPKAWAARLTPHRRVSTVISLACPIFDIERAV